MNYLNKTLIVVFLLFASVANASNNSFVGIIGAAIGDIKNQKDEKLANGSKIFFGDTIISIVNQMHKYYFLIKLY